MRFNNFSKSLGFALESLLLLNLVLCASSFTLGSKISFTDFLLLELVNGLDQDILVLELVTLSSKIKLVVNVLVDLLGVTILLEQASEDTDSAHPKDVVGHTSLSCTLSLTSAKMAA